MSNPFILAKGILLLDSEVSMDGKRCCNEKVFSVGLALSKLATREEIGPVTYQAAFNMAEEAECDKQFDCKRTQQRYRHAAVDKLALEWEGRLKHAVESTARGVPDVISVNLMQLVGLDRETARKCQDVVRMLYPGKEPQAPTAWRGVHVEGDYMYYDEFPKELSLEQRRQIQLKPLFDAAGMPDV